MHCFLCLPCPSGHKKPLFPQIYTAQPHGKWYKPSVTPKPPSSALPTPQAAQMELFRSAEVMIEKVERVLYGNIRPH